MLTSVWITYCFACVTPQRMLSCIDLGNILASWM